MTVTVANLPYSFCPNASSQSNLGFMYKNAYDAFFYSNATATSTQITDPDYPGYHTYTISVLTSVTTVATATTSTNHGLSVNDSITISGASPAAYNGVYSVTSVVDSTHFTYTFAGGTSPATGTISAVGGKTTVSGIVFLDGYFFVLDSNATIRSSNLNDPLVWSALDFITAQIEPGAGVAIGKSQNYIIVFKEWSTEFFYDAANPVGSPLSTVGNGFNLVGCLNGESVANLDGTLFWASQTRQKGRGVHMMKGLQEQQISTPDIERILNLSTFATVYSYGVKIGGHAFYILTLVDQNITLVYDMVSQIWSQWSSLTLGTPVSVTSITLVGTTATVTCGAAHNLLDGDPVSMAGANQGAYNGIFVTSYVSTTQFTFQTIAGSVTPATGTITSTPYTETYFKYTKYVNALSRDLVQHETNGTLCELTESSYADVGVPVNVLIRTGKLDGGTINLKRYATLEIIGNKVVGSAYVRHSGDDYVTYTKYRPVDLNANRSLIRRLGADRRRSYDIRYLGSTSLQLGAIDVEVV